MSITGPSTDEAKIPALNQQNWFSIVCDTRSIIIILTTTSAIIAIYYVFVICQVLHGAYFVRVFHPHYNSMK